VWLLEFDRVILSHDIVINETLCYDLSLVLLLLYYRESTQVTLLEVEILLALALEVALVVVLNIEALQLLASGTTKEPI